MINAVTMIKGITGVPGPNQNSMTALPIPKNHPLPLNNPIMKKTSAQP